MNKLIKTGGAMLAPMAGITDVVFRLLCLERGCVGTMTEMVSAKGFLYAPKNRATTQLLTRAVQEKNCSLQLFGNEADLMAEAAVQLYRNFDSINLNMGCPAPKITGQGQGCALMQNPRLASNIIQSVVKAVPCPVTVKFRKGWQEDSCLEFAKMAQDSGAAALILHPRERRAFYSGQADWDCIRRVKEAANVPVIGNGDVRSGQDALKLFSQTGCDAIMIGRGAQGNPFLFEEIACTLSKKTYTHPTNRQRLHEALRHVHMMVAWKGESIGLREMRKHVAWYIKGMKGGAALRALVNTQTTLSGLQILLLGAADNED